MLYQTWLNIWLENYIKPFLKLRTYVKYRQIVYNHIVGGLGKNELKNLTPALLQEFVTSLLNCGNIKTFNGLSSNSVNSVVTVLQSSLKTAYNLGYIKEYIGDRVVRPKIIEKRIECFSVAEQKEIERFCLNSDKKKLYGIVICLYTGLRIGELLALKYSDVNFETSVLSVTKTCYDTPQGRVLDTPKTHSSIRIIPLPKPILNLIKQLKKDSFCDYLIEDKQKPVAIRSYQRTFELLLKKLNISHKGFHSLRHTFATRALECGMDVKTLSELLGHKNTNITLNRYVHSMFEHKVEMMNRLAKVMGKITLE